MWSDLLIFLGISTIAAKILDFYMSDGQKKRVAEIVLRIWNWLDEAKRVPILDMARSRRAQRILSGLLAGMVLLAVSMAFLLALPHDAGIAKDDEAPMTLADIAVVIGISLAIAAPIAWVGSRIVSIILRGRTPLQLLVRTILAFALACLPLLLVIGAGAVKYGRDILSPDAEVGLYFILVYFGLGLSMFVSGILLLFWLIPVVLVVLIYAASLLLYTTEVTVRRIAESPNGPVLAAGALLGTVGALIRAFGGS